MFCKISLMCLENLFGQVSSKYQARKKGIKAKHLTSVVQRLANAIHCIKLYAVDNAIRFAITFPSHSSSFVA